MACLMLQVKKGKLTTLALLIYVKNDLISIEIIGLWLDKSALEFICRLLSTTP